MTNNKDPICELIGRCCAPIGTKRSTNCINCGKELLQDSDGQFYTYDADKDGKPQDKEI